MRRREFIAGLGGVVAWPFARPLAAEAQPSGARVIGYLDWNAPQTRAPYVEALRAGLGEAGFIEGRNLTIEYRWGIADYRQMLALAADLVRRQVAVIVAVGALARHSPLRPRPPPFRSFSITAAIPWRTVLSRALTGRAATLPE
jgi:putative ABC transport system substrate-binding protein